MIGHGLSKKSEPPGTEHVQIVALYEPESGRIRHLHIVTTLGGEKPPPPDEAVTEAWALATTRNAAARDLAVALSNDRRHAEGPHRIDPKTKVFVAVSEGPTRKSAL